MRDIIEVRMKDVDFGQNKIIVSVLEWGSVGAGRYRLVPILDDEDNITRGSHGVWGSLAQNIYEQESAGE